jgi:putative sterol carrier protein
MREGVIYVPYAYGTDEWEEAYQEELSKRMESEPQPYIIPTPEWVAVYEKALQGDAEYKEVAKDWEGSVALHVQAKPEYGLDDDLYGLLDLWHGECRSIRIVPEEAGESADFVITASADRWLSVFRKELEPVKGMMQGKLKLKGDLPTIVRNVRAATRLVDIIVDVGGRFPDTLNPEEVESLRAVVLELRERFNL